MYPFTKYLKFLIKDVKIVWVRSMKGISSPPPGTVDRDRRNTPHARTAMSIFSLRLMQPLIVWAPSGGGL